MDWIKYEADGSDYVSMERWGNDHWSTLLYLETRAVDGGGIIENRQMRCNTRLHRKFANRRAPDHSVVDGEKYPTRLKDGHLANHDDWSCLEDIVKEGLIEAWYRVKYHDEVFGNKVARIELTELGWWLVGQLRIHKATGGQLATFCPELP